MNVMITNCIRIINLNNVIKKIDSPVINTEESTAVLLIIYLLIYLNISMKHMEGLKLMIYYQLKLDVKLIPAITIILNGLIIIGMLDTILARIHLLKL